jgi:hypothetical protein
MNLPNLNFKDFGINDPLKIEALHYAEDKYDMYQSSQLFLMAYNKRLATLREMYASFQSIPEGLWDTKCIQKEVTMTPALQSAVDRMLSPNRKPAEYWLDSELEKLYTTHMKDRDPFIIPYNSPGATIHINTNIDGLKIDSEPTWQLVKEMEEAALEQQNELSLIIGTLVVNFSELNEGRHPVLIGSKDKPFTMLSKVLEYYARCEKELDKMILR